MLKLAVHVRREPLSPHRHHLLSSPSHRRPPGRHLPPRSGDQPWRRYHGDLLARRMASTAATYHKVLKILYGWLADEEEIPVNPMAK
jgi:hypothetical protein